MRAAPLVDRSRSAPRPVLLHGFTGGPGSWAAVSGLMPEPVALVLPGHGPKAPIEAADFEGNVDAVAARLRASALLGCHLVGYSLGARVALSLALRHREIPARLSLIGVHPGLGEAERDARRSADRRWIDLLRRRGLEAFVAAWERQPVFAGQEALGARALEAQRRLRLSHDAEALARSLETMGLGQMPDYRPRLGELSVPTRLIVGGRDDKFLALARAVVRAHPHLDLHVIGDCGHNPLLERPEELAALLRSS